MRSNGYPNDNKWTISQNLSQYSRKSKNSGPLIAVMNIQIAKDQKDKIYIHEFDDDYELALAFKQKHNLNEKTFSVLHQQIIMNKKALKQNTSISENKYLDKMQEPIQEIEKNRQSINRNQHQYNHDYQQFQQNSNIFNKLKQQSLKRSSMKQSFEQNSRKNQNKQTERNSLMQRSRSSVEITNRLYNQNKIKHDYLKSIQKKAQQKIQKIKDEEELTYAPKINPISQVLASQRKNNKKIQQYLYQQKTKLQLKKQKQRSMYIKKLMSDCTFKPNLNKITQELAEHRPKHTNTYQMLAKQTLKSKIVCQNIPKESFKPQINKISQQIMQEKGVFLDRVKQFEQQKLVKMNKIYKQVKKYEHVDKQSGQQLFKPHISNRLVPKGRKKQNLDIGQYLYQLSKNKKNILIQKPQVKINQHSQNIIKELQFKRIVWIFSELDSDQDGTISSNKICIDTIPSNVLEIIMPILFEMQQFNFELNLQQFKQSIQALHNSLNSEQKSILYNYKRKKQVQSNPNLTFKPKLYK